MSNKQPKKLIVSFKRVDLNDGDAIEAFAQHVWEQATAAFGERRKTYPLIDENGDDRGIQNDE